MYALIDTMPSADGLTVGLVVSTHRTLDAADAADDKLQRMIRRNNPGGTAYLPTVVAEVADGSY